MTVLEHLEDLRWVVVKSLTVFLLVAMVVVVFVADLTSWLRWPLEVAMGSEERAMETLRTRGPFDVFSVLIQVIFFGSLFLSLPLILYFGIDFILPGLTAKERRVVGPVLTLAFVSFLAGAGFAFGILLPAALSASVYFNEMLGFQELWSPADYYTTVVWGSILAGIVFEVPLLVCLLIYLEFISTAILTKNWRTIVVILMVVAALISPGGDPVSFVLVMIPLYLLFGLSILGGRWMERLTRARKAAEAAEESGRSLEGEG